MTAASGPLVVGSSGCAAPVSEGAEDEHPAPLGTTSGAITGEHPGTVDVAARMYVDPDLALASYAMPTTGTCSATMTGPNTMMTAAHCGGVDTTIAFRTFRDLDPTRSDTETFACRILINTFPLSDMTLFFCDPNARGESPGDKYGHLDFDTSTVTAGQAVARASGTTRSSRSVCLGRSSTPAARSPPRPCARAITSRPSSRSSRS